ncbi:hypothetical protein EFS28_05005 [Lactobacillus acidophilus]|uniref:ThiF family adenylyltransferase n=1 Tax=Lactobacillus acidophilus TaxID=1579 RepID=UPI0021A59661|nr:ThiF family adenylyltransferase [Lactobacillus acidophilus]MCT3602487.1 hypothetical protein [Lactobacillus acidophilus]MCT3623587.1 hypothetical protein [Lactobacillus acidophilus]
MFILNEGIHVFESLDGNKLIIRNYTNAKIMTINNQRPLEKLLILLKKPQSLENIFKNIKISNLDTVLQLLLKEEVIIKLVSKKSKRINVAVIGIGTTGSHIVNDLRNLTEIKKLIICDPDTVDESNLYRQVYVESDLNKNKVDVFAKEGGKCDQIIGLKNMYTSSNQIIEMCKQYDVNVLIQAGDYPTTRELGILIEHAANKLNIPYIINSGYVSNVVSLPEFYYPNNDYDFIYKHQTYNEKPILLKVNKKVSFRMVANVGHIVAQQIIDYCADRKPIKYGERGFFDGSKFEWRTEKFE